MSHGTPYLKHKDDMQEICEIFSINTPFVIKVVSFLSNYRHIVIERKVEHKLGLSREICIQIASYLIGISRLSSLVLSSKCIT